MAALRGRLHHSRAAHRSYGTADDERRQDRGSALRCEFEGRSVFPGGLLVGLLVLEDETVTRARAQSKELLQGTRPARLIVANRGCWGRISTLKGNRKRKANGDWFSACCWRRRLPVLRSIFHFFEEVLVGISLFVDLHVPARIHGHDDGHCVRQLPRLTRHIRELHQRIPHPL